MRSAFRGPWQVWRCRQGPTCYRWKLSGAGFHSSSAAATETVTTVRGLRDGYRDESGNEALARIQFMSANPMMVVTIYLVLAQSMIKNR